MTPIDLAVALSSIHPDGAERALGIAAELTIFYVTGQHVSRDRTDHGLVAPLLTPLLATLAANDPFAPVFGELQRMAIAAEKGQGMPGFEPKRGAPIDLQPIHGTPYGLAMEMPCADGAGLLATLLMQAERDLVQTTSFIASDVSRTSALVSAAQFVATCSREHLRPAQLLVNYGDPDGEWTTVLSVVSRDVPAEVRTRLPFVALPARAG